MTFADPAALPPTTLPVLSGNRMATPASLGTASSPSTSVPMKLPSMRVPLPKVIVMPRLWALELGLK